MAEPARLPLAAGGYVLIELDQEKSGVTRASSKPGQKAIAQLEKTLQESLAPLKNIAEDIAAAVRADQGPGGPEWSVSFGVTISAAAGVIIANTGGEANFSVTVTWPAGR